MKSYLQILFCLLLITQLAFPQWTNQNPVPDGNHLWCTYFVNDSTGWIVGSEGLIKKTTNNGVDWIQQNSSTILTLRSVQFVDQNIGWICGESGLILKTTNGGASWDSLTSGTTEYLTGIHFYDADTGYAVGFAGTILKTTNGGLVWASLSSGTTVELNSIDFFNALLGYAVGGDEYSEFIVIKTTDGGASWIDKASGLTSLFGGLMDVEVIDANTAFIGGGVQYSNFINKTTDGGDTWILQSLPPTDDKKERNHEEQFTDINYGGINRIQFKDSNIGYAVGGNQGGYSRSIFGTTNGGSTWFLKYVGYQENGLISVCVTNSGIGWAVGFGGVIFITEDDGNSWAQIHSGKLYNPCTGDDYYYLYMINENIGWIGGLRRTCIDDLSVILKTTNGGKIWKTQLRSGDAAAIPINSVYFIDENIGWAVGEYSVYRTIDGGENWGSSISGGSSIFFVNQDTGWMTSSVYNAGIHKSIDGGENWIQKSSINSSSVYFLDANTGWATSVTGILKSTDGGESWINKTSLTGSHIKFYNSNVGMCVGGVNVLVSTDGGETWTAKSGPSLQAINFINSTSIWGYSSEGTVYKTNDFGNNWESLNSGLGFGQQAFFVNEYTGWVCEENNIFKYSVEPPQPPVWSNNIIVEDSSGTESSQLLTFGQHTDATDSLDSLLGEYELPPPPPAQIFDARFNLPTTPIVSSLIDYRVSAETDINWRIKFQPDNLAYPMTFTWDSTSFPEGTSYLKDWINGNFAFVNMKEQGSFTLNEPAISSLDISYRGNCPIVSVLNDWNMISVPLLAEDMSLGNLYPAAISQAYGYDGGYISEDTLALGKGYWLKFGGNEDMQICGSLLGDTVQVQEGWNMCGGYEDDILISEVTTTPPGIVATFFFGYNDGYYIADTLKSGQGFWVRVTEDGVLNLNGGTAAIVEKKQPFTKITQNWGRIKMTDNEGKRVILYAAEQELEPGLYELPPLPPNGVFDVRYGSGRIVEDISSEQIIRISSDNYPITIRAEGLSLSVRDGLNGKLLNKQLNNGEELTITNNKITSVVVKGIITGGLPISYDLNQNYPNPFNPSTIIKFALPQDSEVNLTVFNILGEKVAQLVNQEMKAGYHQVEFDASYHASGVYLYSITAGEFISTKKMVLLR